MIVGVRTFDAIYSATWDDWEIEANGFIIKVKYLLVSGIDGIKTKWQRLKGTNVIIELTKKDNEGMVILLSWYELEKKRLYDLGDPDKPRNLAKVVTVK